MPRGSSASCSLDVDAGDRYVIHAGGGADGYSTSLCQGSYGLKKDAPLPELPPPGGVVTGTLVRFSRDGFERRAAAHRRRAALDHHPRRAHRIEDRRQGHVQAERRAARAVDRAVRRRADRTRRGARRAAIASGLRRGLRIAATGRPADRLGVRPRRQTHRRRAGLREAHRHTSAWFGIGVETGPSGAFSMSGLAAGSYVVGVGLLGRAQREVSIPACLPPRRAGSGVRQARRDRRRDRLPAGHPDARACSARLDRGRDRLPRWHQAGQRLPHRRATAGAGPVRQQGGTGPSRRRGGPSSGSSAAIATPSAARSWSRSRCPRAASEILAVDAAGRRGSRRAAAAAGVPLCAGEVHRA